VIYSAAGLNKPALQPIGPVDRHASALADAAGHGCRRNG
jgi:hypothetical protein